METYFLTKSELFGYSRNYSSLFRGRIRYAHKISCRQSSTIHLSQFYRNSMI